MTAAAVEVRERGILFSVPMVRAILEGRKTQTRRVLRRQPPSSVTDIIQSLGSHFVSAYPNRKATRPFEFSARCPFGHVGDRLWVRETAWYDKKQVVYAGLRVFFEGGDVRFERGGFGTTPGLPENSCAEVFNLNSSLVRRPSIHMPRWASRITLEVTAVRVERLQSITEDDATDEGLEGVVNDPVTDGYGEWTKPYVIGAREQYRELWDSLNAKRGYGWDVNPWVWVVEFKRVEEATI